MPVQDGAPVPIFLVCVLSAMSFTGMSILLCIVPAEAAIVLLSLPRRLYLLDRGVDLGLVFGMGFLDAL